VWPHMSPSLFLYGESVRKLGRLELTVPLFLQNVENIRPRVLIPKRPATVSKNGYSGSGRIWDSAKGWSIGNFGYSISPDVKAGPS